MVRIMDPEREAAARAAQRVIVDAVRAEAQRKIDRRGVSDPILSYLRMNAESITRDAGTALAAAGLLAAPPNNDLLAALDEIVETARGHGLLQPGAAYALGCLGAVAGAEPGWSTVDLADALAALDGDK